MPANQTEQSNVAHDAGRLFAVIGCGSKRISVLPVSEVEILLSAFGDAEQVTAKVLALADNEEHTVYVFGNPWLTFHPVS